MARKIAKKDREKYAFLSGMNIGVGLALFLSDPLIWRIVGFLNIVGGFTNIWRLWLKEVWVKWRDVLID